MGRSESPDDRRRRRSSRDDIDKSERRRGDGSSHKRRERSLERRDSRRSRSGSRERRRSSRHESPGGRPKEARPPVEGDKPIDSDWQRRGDRESPRDQQPLERRGPFTPFGKGKGSWGKGRFGDSHSFGKGKGKGFKGGKGGRWSGSGKGAAVVWRHDKFEEEMKEAEEEAHEEPAQETTETMATHDHQESTKKPIKFDLYAEKLDDNVVQAVLDNVRERIDKRREVMQQKREERDAEVKKMIDAGENPFIRKPREGERSGGWTRDGSAPWGRRGSLPSSAHVSDTIERYHRPGVGSGARSAAPYNRREPERRPERHQSNSPVVKRQRDYEEDLRADRNETEKAREEDKIPRASRREENPREELRRSSGEERRQRSPLSRQQHRGLKMEQQGATRDMQFGDRDRERSRSRSKTPRRARGHGRSSSPSDKHPRRSSGDSYDASSRRARGSSRDESRHMPSRH